MHEETLRRLKLTVWCEFHYEGVTVNEASNAQSNVRLEQYVISIGRVLLATPSIEEFTY